MVLKYKGQAHTSEMLSEKMLELEKSMQKNPGWKGCLSKVDGFVADFEWPLDPKPELLNQAGGYPWLACMRRHAFRYGPAGMPLPGVGCFVTPTTSAFWVLTFDVDGLLKHNIKLRDASTFFETATAAKFKDENISVTLLAVDETMWIPFGTIAMPLFCPEDEELEVCTAWVLSYWSDTLAKQVPDPSWKAILTFNREHFVRNEASRLWKVRSQTFEDFAKRVGVQV